MMSNIIYLTRQRTVAIEDVRVKQLRFNKDELAAHLKTLWAMRGSRCVVLPYNVRVSRLLAALRRRFDYEGWRLIAITSPDANSVAVSVRQKYRGARPSRVVSR